MQYRVLFASSLVLLFQLVACGGGSSSRGSDAADVSDAGDASEDGSPPGPCADPTVCVYAPQGPCSGSILVEAPPETTSIKEIEVRFQFEGCGEARTLWVANGPVYRLATKIGDASYQGSVSLVEGDNAVFVTLKTTDGVESASEVFPVFYERAEASSTTGAAHVGGRVFDDETGEPLAGAEVSARGLPGVVVTDAEGAYQLPVEGGRVLVVIEKRGYSSAQRWLQAEATQWQSAGDAYLVEVDAATLELGAGEAGDYASSDGRFGCEIPEGATRFPMNLSGLNYGRARSLPGALPDSSAWTQAFELYPDGARFETPVHARQENVNGLPPGTKVPVGYYNRDRGAWEATTMGTVSADGAWVEFETEHFSSFDCNFPSRDRGRPDGRDMRPDPCNNSTGGGSSIDDLRGSLTTHVSLGGFWEDGRWRSVNLVYDSDRAAGEIKVLAHMALPDDRDTLEGVDAELSFAGRSAHLTAPVGTEESSVLVGARFSTTGPDGIPLAPGYHPLTLSLSALQTSTYMTTDSFGSGGIQDLGVETREALPFTTRRQTMTSVASSAGAPFGKGWTLDILETVAFDDPTRSGIWWSGAQARRINTGFPTAERLEIPGVNPIYIDDLVEGADGRVWLSRTGVLYNAPSWARLSEIQELPGSVQSTLGNLQALIRHPLGVLGWTYSEGYHLSTIETLDGVDAGAEPFLTEIADISALVRGVIKTRW